MNATHAMRLPPPRPTVWTLRIGAFGLVGCVIGLVVAPQSLGRAWLAAFVFGAGFPLGALTLHTIGALTGGRWVAPVQPILRAGAATLPALALAMIPVLVALPWLYPWTSQASPTHTLYLNIPFFVLRNIVYLAIWAGLWLGVPRRVPSPAAAILLLFSLSFAAIDWVMSIDAPWSSSVFGLLMGAVWVSTALAGAVLLYARSVMPERATLHALGTMLFAGTLVTAYLVFMQFLIIWEENLPDEIVWYTRRAGGPLTAILGAAILLQFIVPFLLLLFRRVKESPCGLGLAASCVLLGSWLSAVWLVAGPQTGWLNLAASMVLGGAMGAAFLWQEVTR